MARPSAGGVRRAPGCAAPPRAQDRAEFARLAEFGSPERLIQLHVHLVPMRARSVRDRSWPGPRGSRLVDMRKARSRVSASRRPSASARASASGSAPGDRSKPHRRGPGIGGEAAHALGHERAAGAGMRAISASRFGEEGTPRVGALEGSDRVRGAAAASKRRGSRAGSPRPLAVGADRRLEGSAGMARPGPAMAPRSPRIMARSRARSPRGQEQRLARIPLDRWRASARS